MDFIRRIDLAFAEFAASMNDGYGILTAVFKIITLSGTIGAIFIVASIILAVFKKTRFAGLKAGMALFFGFLLTNLLLKNVVARPRPYADVTSRFFEIWQKAGSMKESGYSFPSGHTTAAAAFSVALFLSFNKKFSWAFLFIPFVMGFTRIYFCVHYASDVAGGLLVGLVSGVCAHFAMNATLKKLAAKNNKKLQ